MSAEAISPSAVNTFEDNGCVDMGGEMEPKLDLVDVLRRLMADT